MFIDRLYRVPATSMFLRQTRSHTALIRAIHAPAFKGCPPPPTASRVEIAAKVLGRPVHPKTPFLACTPALAGPRVRAGSVVAQDTVVPLTHAAAPLHPVPGRPARSAPGSPRLLASRPMCPSFGFPWHFSRVTFISLLDSQPHKDDLICLLTLTQQVPLAASSRTGRCQPARLFPFPPGPPGAGQHSQTSSRALLRKGIVLSTCLLRGSVPPPSRELTGVSLGWVSQTGLGSRTRARARRRGGGGRAGPGGGRVLLRRKREGLLIPLSHE